MELRFYQSDAVAAVYEHLRTRSDNPVVVIPTGGGKTPVIATICRDVVQWGGRVLVLAHVKELLVQSVDKLKAICPEISVGIFSAGLKRRDTSQSVIVAGIQSIYNKACDLDGFDVIIIDEAHMIPATGDGMYRQFLADAKVINPKVRVIGLTATPYRLDNGAICSPEHFLNEICYEIGVRELIVKGYLSPLISPQVAPEAQANLADLHLRGGEFIAGEAENAMDDELLVQATCAEIVQYATDRQAILLFSTGVKHGQHIVKILAEKHGVECGFVCGETPDGERDELLRRFQGAVNQSNLFGEKLKPLKWLCNVNVLTTGFDAPHIDLVGLLRPTNSPGLFYQMVGRGFRLFPGKKDCLVLDYGENIMRHGPVDQLKAAIKKTSGTTGEAPAKVCPGCKHIISAAYCVCPDCGHEFPVAEKTKHTAKASDEGILSDQVVKVQHAVRAVYYSLHVKAGAGPETPRTLRVDYDVGIGMKSEWICLEHTGFARRKAEIWWRNHSEYDIPESIEEALQIANHGGLAPAKSITVRKAAGQKYEEIVSHELDEIPPVGIVEMKATELGEIPF